MRPEPQLTTSAGAQVPIPRTPGPAGPITQHRTLARQLRRCGLDSGELSEPLSALVAMVERSYDGYEQMHYLTERAMDLSSTEMNALHAQLRENFDHLAAIFDGLGVGVCVLDSDGTVVRVNPAAASLLRRDAHTLIRRPLSGLFETIRDPQQGRDVDLPAMLELLSNHADGLYRDVALVFSDGVSQPVSMALTHINHGGLDRSSVLVLRDIRAELEAKALLQWHASHDTLTGLLNRGAFEDVLDRFLRALPPGTPRPSAALLYLDFDRFKQVNDSLGHGYGDMLLRQACDRLADQLRPDDVLARLSGDEFAILTHDIDAACAVGLAERLLAALARPFDLAGNEAQISASCGVAVLSSEHTRVGWLTEADQAMYHAKAVGKATVRIYDDELRDRDTRHLHLEEHLRRAVARRELRLVVQPQVALDSSAIVSFEALLRWDGAGRSVPPDVFIPLAEECGLVHEIGHFVLSQAGEVTKRTGARLAVNVSPLQIMAGRLPDHLARLARQGVVDPSRLTLEVTEGVLLTDPAFALEQLHRLKDLGCLLSIDDFGTGYSSLLSLKTYPFDEVKIDRSFVCEIASDAPSLAVVRAVTQMAHALGKTVVAEGIETAEQLDVLRDLECDLGQGYLFGRPAPFDTFAPVPPVAR